MDRPITTLFMLMSVDGKISTGAVDDLDVDKDFVVIDNRHLDEHGIQYFCALLKKFVLITSNAEHPAFQIKEDNIHIIYQKELLLEDALRKLKSEYGCERLTVQTGGTLNGLFLRETLRNFFWAVSPQKSHPIFQGRLSA